MLVLYAVRRVWKPFAVEQPLTSFFLSAFEATIHTAPAHWTKFSQNPRQPSWMDSWKPRDPRPKTPQHEGHSVWGWMRVVSDFANGKYPLFSWSLHVTYHIPTSVVKTDLLETWSQLKRKRKRKRKSAMQIIYVSNCVQTLSSACKANSYQIWITWFSFSQTE